MACYCKVGLHIECVDLTANDDGSFSCCCVVSDVTPEPTTETEPAASRYKDNESVGDVLSTGRKRAAVMYPVDDGMLCEWAFLLYAGGGPLPIIGCAGNVLYAAADRHALHHGPDKNTLNNEVGNVHRICPHCHNRWHTLNDQFYGKRPEAGKPFIPLFGEVAPHDPDTKASELQVAHAEKWWATPEKKRGEYRVG